MGLRINTNVASLRAQRALSRSTSKLETAMTRLSTGLRINTGSDDVAGLSKSESLRTQIRGIDRAKANITAASSVLGVSEGYLAELTEISQSLREIAVQAADDTISPSDRSSLINQYNSLAAEYSRLADNAEFNGVNLLTGTFTNKVVQVGTNEGDTISVSIDDARAASIGRVASYTTQTRTGAGSTTGQMVFSDPSGISIAGTAIATTAFESDGVSAVEDSESALAYVNAINSYSSTTGVTAYVNANVLTFDYSSGDALAAGNTLSINGITVKDNSNSYASTDSGVADIVALINDNSSQTGVTATQDSGTDEIVLTATDGRNISVQVGGSADSTVATDVFGMTGDSYNRNIVYRGTFDIQGDSGFSIVGGDTEFASAATVSTTLGTNGLSTVSLTTATSSGEALTILDNVINQLQARRATVGSAINRFQTAENELSSRSESLSAAESSIRDADIAAETAKLTQANILQQAGVAVLTQANSSPEIALQLLQNL